MPSERLVQGSRRPQSTASASTSAHNGSDLPPYEPPSHPMNDAGRQALANITNNNQEVRKYEDHLSKSATYLREAVGAINDTLFARKSQLTSKIEKRRGRGEAEKGEDEAELEEYVNKLNGDVTHLTDEIEAALRQVIDYRAQVQGDKLVLDSVMNQVQSQKPRRERPSRKRKAAQRANDDSDEEMAGVDDGSGEEEAAEAEDEAPLTGVREALHKAREVRARQYRATSAYDRYASNNEYISFKKMWHDAQHPQDQVPLPDASTWFDNQGRPIRDGAPVGDEDLIIEREVQDLTCKLTLRPFREPYANHQCPHVFEKSALLEYLRHTGGKAQCPVCTKELRIKDLYLDELMLRKVKRAALAARSSEDRSSNADPDERMDESVLVGESTQLRSGRANNAIKQDDSE
ncbi:zinc-finger of the MIZ type in Nse subunit-domain-containing protein [Pseudoneurospora amorphoporcata]|uniref:Zinc-finger of the MIZ type in Nse subunit-domain-containing protein n=1 Tax=Pseudoneurospora amorphoporcata TaxID=241081 RepID=A0AAN6SIS3_9PEZI|nr:zinc-finger of the MIZ type in Nse subunit-domain-containing protein [Pseudoneurospora amorphoporcata]